MATNVQYNFPIVDRPKASEALQKAITDSINQAISRTVPGDVIDELTIKILGIATPVADITEEVIKIALNPQDYGVGELTASAFKIASGLIVSKAVGQILAETKLNYFLGVGLEALGVGSFTYLSEISNLNIAFDALLGTFDAELRLIDQNGNLLGGGFYIDGLEPKKGEVLQATRGLLREANSRKDVPRIEEGAQIALVRPQLGTSNLAIYTLYDGEIVSQLAETTNQSVKHILEEIKPFFRNQLYYQSYGEKKFLVMSDADEFDIENPSTGEKASFTPKQIFYNDENGVLRALDKTEVTAANANSSGNNLYIGNTGNDLTIAYAGNDLLFGGKKNDILLGGDGNDTLTGSSGQTIPDGFEKDFLIGGTGADTFILGDRNSVFYDDGKDIDPNPPEFAGRFPDPFATPNDFAFLIDYNPNEGDVIQQKEGTRIYTAKIQNKGILESINRDTQLKENLQKSGVYSKLTQLDPDKFSLGFTIDNGELIGIAPENLEGPFDLPADFRLETVFV
jgi:hypothetical protein